MASLEFRNLLDSRREDISCNDKIYRVEKKISILAEGGSLHFCERKDVYDEDVFLNNAKGISAHDKIVNVQTIE